MRIVADRQTEQRRGVFERATPVREVVRAARIAGEPVAHVDAELVQTALLGVVHRLDELVGPDQFPVLGDDLSLRSLVQIAGRAQLCRTYDARPATIRRGRR